MFRPLAARVVLGIFALASSVPAAFGQSGCFIPNGGCHVIHENQCFPGAGGPTYWSDGLTAQHRGSSDSPNTTCHAPVIAQPPHCCTSSHPPGSSQPTISLRLVGQRVFVDYDAPNYYCQNDGEWPPFYTCTNDPIVSSDNLQLWLETEPVDVLRRTFIYYENGTWDTGFDLACGQSLLLTARIQYLTTAGEVAAMAEPMVLKAVDCPDRRYCPIGAGKPINTGSGDAAATVPLFTLAQPPLPLAFGLSYHSETPRYPGLVSSPVGLGWTHPFAQTLRPIDRFRSRLYHLTAEGFESEYAHVGDGRWVALSPGELRGEVTEIAGQYLLTDLDGTTTAFDTSTGRWLSTTDRWGNAIQGGYDGSGSLVTLTDSEGRVIALTYAGSHLVTVVLPEGQTWRFAYDGDVLARIFDPLHTGVQPWRSFSYTADSLGVVRLLTAELDEAGFLLEGHGYDLQDRGITSVSEGGRDSVTFEYGLPAAGQTRVTHTIDGAASQVSVFTLKYGEGRYLATQILGNCLSCGNAASDNQFFTYFADNHVASRTDGNGHVTKYAYNADGNLSSMTEASGTPQERTSTYRYDYAPWVNFRTEIDEPSAAKPGAQKVTTYAWNSSGPPETTLTTSEAGFLSTSDATPTVYLTTTTFDAHHRMVALDGPRTDVADVTTRTYFGDTDADPNRRGRLQAATDPSGNTTTFDYDEYGTAHTTTDPNGVVTVRQTDPKGRVIAGISKAVPGVAGEASDYTTTYSFDGRDRLGRTALPRGNGMEYVYEDGTNRLIDTIRVDAAGNQLERRHLTLNAIGDKVTEEDQSCDAPGPACPSWTTRRSESFAYDAHNRLAGVVHPVPAGSRTFDAYDPDGLLLTVQDEGHSSPNTRYAYDALHRLVAAQQTLVGAPGGTSTTGYTYDVMDNLASVTDPNGNLTRYSYDDFRRLQRQDSPVTGTTTYQYDPAGNLISTTDARGAVTARTYDASNRLLTSTSQLAGSATETVSYGYDSATSGRFGRGRLAQMTDPSGSTSYTYERRGLLKSEQRSILGTDYATGYQYDPNGNRSGLTYPSGRQVSYAFDFADRPASASSPTTLYVSSASYLPFGPETRLVFGNGTVKTMASDLRYRPLENRLDGSSSTIADYLYQEDPVGNITEIHDALDSSFNRDFRYDDLYRLTGATTGDSLWGTGTYSYDPMGNMTALSLGSSRSAAFSYQGTLPKLASVVEDGIARAVSYDAAGNEQAVGSGAMTYSARNLLAAADGLSYTYDGRGIRVALSVTAAPGTITGTVVDTAGAALSGATVRITGSAVSTTTDGAGNFTLTAPAGIYTVVASLAVYLPATSLPFALPAGGTFGVGILRLAPAPCQITGTVLNSLNAGPLAGATISLAESPDTAFTDAAGNFALTEPAGTYTVSIAQAGYATQTLPSFALAQGKTHSIGTVTLVANPATVTGRVVSSVGATGIAGATVQAAGNPSLTTLTTTTDASGAFTLTLSPGTWTFTISKAGFGSRTTSPASFGPGATLALGTLSLDPLGTITGTVVRANGGAPVLDATVLVSGTLNEVLTDTAGNFSLTQAPGTYRLKVSAPGLSDLLTPPVLLPVGATVAVGTLELSPVALSVFVAYADGSTATPSLPNPWQSAPNTVFLGNGPVFDSGAIRLDNSSDAAIQVDRVTVDLERPGPVFSLWGNFTVPAHGSVILTQTAPFNFDTSDWAIAACGQTVPSGDPRVPKVTVTVAGADTDYFDTGFVLETGGSNLGGCGHNESLPWHLIGTSGFDTSGSFELTPAIGTAALGTSFSLTATVTDPNHQPLPDAQVTFKVTSGPNQGLTSQVHTDVAGRAVFTYVSHKAGVDVWQASLPNTSGPGPTSNLATVEWPPLAGIEIFVGYAEDDSAISSFPNPWSGSPGVVVHGIAHPVEASALRLDNDSDAAVTVDGVSVNFHGTAPITNLWGSFTIPAHGKAVLTQTVQGNFDGSDHAPFRCGQVPPLNSPLAPTVTVTIGGFPASYQDVGFILEDGGSDLTGSCGLPNESLQWRSISAYTAGFNSPGSLQLFPATAAEPLGASAVVTAVATDAGREAIIAATVTFKVLSGPRAGTTAQVQTDNSGIARFVYTSTVAGVDTVQATLANASGGVLTSNKVTVLWLPSVTMNLSPASAQNPVGSAYTATLTVKDNTNKAVANLDVTFRVTAGPDAGLTGSGTTDVNGQAVFTYTSMVAGTDTLEADLSLQGGGTLSSNQVTSAWTAPWSLTLAPPTQTQVLGATATLTANLQDSTQQPVPGVPVILQVTSGPNAGPSTQATTDASGSAAFAHTSAVTGTDALQAFVAQGASTVLSNVVTTTWIAIPTSLTYLGLPFGEYNDPLTLSARLTDATSGSPIAGQVVSFDLGGQTASATTDAGGIATVMLAPTGAPGTTPLAIGFAGAGPYTGSTASALLGIHRDDTAIVYTGKPALANGLLQAVSAQLTDAEDHAPLAGKIVTFTVGAITVSAVTDAAGNATATMTLPATLPLGATSIQVAFAGDTYELPATTRAPLVLYQASSFVIWGGNPRGLALGQRVNFWGSQWVSQVTGGDFDTHADFKGYAVAPSSPAGICEPTATTTGQPALDPSCWTSKSGNSSPPATVADFIQVIVATSIAKSGSTIYGNIAATVVVQVDRTSPYGPDPGHPGFGTIVAVIDDGVALFPRTAAARSAILAQANQGAAAAKTLSLAPSALTAGTKRYFFYTPEMHLLAESELSASPHPLILNEYVWFNDKPVAQADMTDETSWTFTDHLGTPILQTSAPQGIPWRAEYEPYGAVFGLRSYDRHQPLRLPGQEAEQLSLGANGVTGRSYSVYRWYESSMGRFTQPDPRRPLVDPRGSARLDTSRQVLLTSKAPFGYAELNPLYWVDRLGLCSHNPVLDGCQDISRGKACCIASCIDDLRLFLCRWEEENPAFTWTGWLKTVEEWGGTGAVLGLPADGIGAAPGWCIGAIAGATAGTGIHAAEHWIAEKAAEEAARVKFGECIQDHCNQQCGPFPCHDLFNLTVGN